MTYAAAAKKRLGFIGDNLRKCSIFAVKFPRIATPRL